MEGQNISKPKNTATKRKKTDMTMNDNNFRKEKFIWKLIRLFYKICAQNTRTKLQQQMWQVFFSSIVNYYFQWRMFVLFLIFATTLSCGSKAAVTANSFQYAHAHDPLVTALSARSLHTNSPDSSNSISNRASASGGIESTNDASGAAVGGNSGSGGGEVLASKTFPLGSQEPSCEQLRAMWIFSKRQSRASEITNEIPTYRDPFAYNVWEPYYSTTRSLGSMRMVPRYGERTRSPVFGRVINREPLLPQRINNMPRQRHLSGNAGVPSKYYRHVGSNGSAVSGTNSNAVAVQGSFQKLKELIWTERAKELTQQRRAEEMAARAAVLKEIANGQNIQPAYKPSYKSDSYLMDENRSPNHDHFEHMSDDHRTATTQNIGKSQSRSLSQAQGQNKFGNVNGGNNNHKIDIPRNRASTSSSIFSGNERSSVGSGRSAGRSLLPSSSYSFDDIGIPKSYPMRPSHFRERNRSLFKQHSQPINYFSRDIRQKETPPIPNNIIFQRLVNEINRHILEQQTAENAEEKDEKISSKINTSIEADYPSEFVDDIALLKSDNNNNEQFEPSNQYTDASELYDYQI